MNEGNLQESMQSLSNLKGKPIKNKIFINGNIDDVNFQINKQNLQNKNILHKNNSYTTNSLPKDSSKKELNSISSKENKYENSNYKTNNDNKYFEVDKKNITSNLMFNIDNETKNNSIRNFIEQPTNKIIKHFSNKDLTFQNNKMKNSKLNSKLEIIESSSLERNKQLQPSKISQSFKKDSCSKTILNNHSRNASKERKIEESHKNSKNKINSKLIKEKIKNENLLKLTFKARDNNEADYKFNDKIKCFNKNNEYSNTKNFMTQKNSFNLLRNESAKIINTDFNKKTLYNNHDNINYLNTEPEKVEIINEPNKLDNYIPKSNSKTIFFGYCRSKENSVNSNFNSSYAKIKPDNSEARNYPVTTGRLESKSKNRNNSFRENQEIPKINCKPKKASCLFLAENEKMLRKMPTLKYENISKKPYNNFQKSLSSKFGYENRNASIETKENPSETFSIDCNSLEGSQNLNSKQICKTEASQDLTNNNSNFIIQNNFSKKNDFGKTNKFIINKSNKKKLSSFIDFLQKEKKSEDLKSSKVQNTLKSTPTINKNTEPNNNLSSSRLFNLENDISVFYAVNSECNSIGTTNLNSKNQNDCNVSNSTSTNYLGNEYVKKLKNTFMQNNSKTSHMQSLRDSECISNKLNCINKDLFSNKLSCNMNNLHIKNNFSNSKKNCNENTFFKNIFENVIAKKLTYGPKNDNCTSNLNSNSKQKVKNLCNSNSNLSLKNYAVAKESSLTNKNRENTKGIKQSRSKSKNNNSTNFNDIGKKTAYFNSNCIHDKEIKISKMFTKENLENFNSLKSPKNSSITNYSNNIDNNLNKIDFINSNNKIESTIDRKLSKDNSARNSISKNKFTINDTEKERPQTAKSRKASGEKSNKQISILKAIDKNVQIKIIPAKTKNNIFNSLKSKVNNNKKDNINQIKNDTNRIKPFENTIHINHNFNHNINHNILINIENPEGLSAENLRKSLQNFNKKNKNNTLQNIKDNNNFQIGRTINDAEFTNFDSELEKEEEISQIDCEYLNTDYPAISSSDNKITDIINSLELAKESNTNIKNHKKNFYKNFSNNNKNYDKPIKDNFELNNNHRNRIDINTENYNDLGNINDHNIKANTNTFNTYNENTLDNSKNFISNKRINLNNNLNFNNEESNEEKQSNLSTRITNKYPLKINLNDKEQNENNNAIDFKLNTQTNNNQWEISNNKSTQFKVLNEDNKLLQELRSKIKQKDKENGVNERINGINFENLRKNLLAKYNKNNKINCNDSYKFDKMEFFKSKNEAMDEYDYSKDVVNTDPIFSINNKKQEKEIFDRKNLFESEFKSNKEKKLSFLNKLQSNLNRISNANLSSKSELNEQKIYGESKSSAKPFLHSESVNFSLKPTEFFKKPTLISLTKNKNLNLSLKFKSNIDNSPKENIIYAKDNSNDAVCANKIKEYDKCKGQESFNKNITNKNRKEKLNTSNDQKEINLIDKKNSLYGSFNLNKKLNKNLSYANKEIIEEESNFDVFDKKSNQNSIKLAKHSFKNSSSSKSKSYSKSLSGSQNKEKESIPKEKDLLEQTISYIISDDEPNSKGIFYTKKINFKF